MKEKNLIALVSCFARGYHYKNNKYKIFIDNIAEKIISWNLMICQKMSYQS